MAMVMVLMAMIAIAGIAGWAAVMAAQAIARGGSSRGLEHKLDAIHDQLADIRADLDTLAERQDHDRDALEERLDFAERVLARGKNEAADS